MKLGDAYTWTPSAWVDGKPVAYEYQSAAEGPRLTGQVIFIDPKGRFFTVEARVGGQVIRESILFVDKKERGT